MRHYQWIKAAGGMFGELHPPARKFNAKQKMICWIAVFSGGNLADGYHVADPISWAAQEEPKQGISAASAPAMRLRIR